MDDKKYEVENKETRELVESLLKKCSNPDTIDILREIMTTVVKFGIESKDKADLKLVNSALKELRYSSRIFSPYRNRRKVVIFGSARSKTTSPEYLMAEDLARKMTQRGYMVVTGGGPGVMEAGNKGAEQGMDFALNIRLPFEQKPNPYLDEKERLINFKYFFTRKLVFIKETNATALFPGGFGTNDEGFEAITLIQTGKSMPRPIVLLEPQGSTYWATWMEFVKKELVNNGYVSENDMELFFLTGSVDQAVRYFEDFYKVYHSVRYCGGSTVIRLNKPISNGKVAALNKEFKDIIVSGKIALSGPTEEEMQKGEYQNLPRLIMNFDKHDYGRFCKMIRTINQE
ncbi:MAG TPA: TIGR00730 family Rossman fold protein [Candidatus Omnitrophota bacterium]|nr:TIGR00730 family Rossman fold protein [Candidatus Omnitrophota bacterium]HPS21063.1 TIGR00730 family Rossman fold protein [Candidatus Omnitrophota bacterium]